MIPEEILRREFEEVDIDPDQVQIECMVDQDGREIKKVKPILIKKELTMNYATQVPFEIDSDEEFSSSPMKSVYPMLITHMSRK